MLHAYNPQHPGGLRQIPLPGALSTSTVSSSSISKEPEGADHPRPLLPPVVQSHLLTYYLTGEPRTPSRSSRNTSPPPVKLPFDTTSTSAYKSLGHQNSTTIPTISTTLYPHPRTSAKAERIRCTRPASASHGQRALPDSACPSQMPPSLRWRRSFCCLLAHDARCPSLTKEASVCPHELFKRRLLSAAVVSTDRKWSAATGHRRLRRRVCPYDKVEIDAFDAPASCDDGIMKGAACQAGGS